MGRFIDVVSTAGERVVLHTGAVVLVLDKGEDGVEIKLFNDWTVPVNMPFESFSELLHAEVVS